jgi:hypothetical protein
MGQVDKSCGHIITLEAITKSHRRFSKVESGLNKWQSVTYAFPKWKVPRTKGKASHMAFQNGKWPKQRTKRHIWLSKVEGGPNKGQSVTFVFPKVEGGMKNRAKRHIWFTKVESGLNKGQSVKYGLPT